MVSLRLAAGLLLTLSSAALSQTVQVCSWMVESVKPENVYQFDVCLQTDGELSFLYKMSGAGVVAGSNKTHSPGSGTYVLHAGKAEKPWGFGTTLYPPAKIDITIELHEMPADIFSEAPTPLLAKFDFRRDVPESPRFLGLAGVQHVRAAARRVRLVRPRNHACAAHLV